MEKGADQTPGIQPNNKQTESTQETSLTCRRHRNHTDHPISISGLSLESRLTIISTQKKNRPHVEVQTQNQQKNAEQAQKTERLHRKRTKETLQETMTNEDQDA